MKKFVLTILLILMWILPMSSQSADLNLELTVDDNLVEVGQTIEFTVIVTNNGPDATTGVSVTDMLPSGLQFVGANPVPGAYNEVNGIWNIGNLGVGNTATLTLFAKVLGTGEHLNLAEVSASGLWDPDSIPNNGVDTDGDGIVTDDPNDEDDGDGQLVIHTSSNSCLAPLDAESNMAPNPMDLNGLFKFDYKIKAIVNFEMGSTDGFNPEYYRGNPNELIMEYYVNSSDGSMLFPGGIEGFFKTNFAYNNDFGRIDAAVWLANGQMVVYGYDAKDDKLRAVTRESIQTADGKWVNDYTNMMQFFSSSQELAESPEPPPSRIQWYGNTVGYKGKLIEAYTGIENEWNLHFDADPTPIKTSCIMMGFMVGVLKDARAFNCNRLLVYTKVDIGGEDSGDSIEAEMKSIKPQGITFNGRPYQPLTVGGDYRTAALEKLDELEDKLRSIEVRRQTLQRERDRCISERCVDQKNAALEDLRIEKSEALCQQMVAMGAEDSFEDCMRIELEGY